MTDGTNAGAAAPNADTHLEAPSAPLERFVRLCVPLTGFSAFDLHGTGMAPLYLDTTRRELGEGHLENFLSRWEQAQAEGKGPAELPPTEREIARALVYLWYTGAWPRIAPAVHAELRRDRPNGESMASATSYPEGLVWRAFGGHPGGAKPPGFGTWSYPPPTLPKEAEIAESITQSAATATRPYDPTAYGALANLLDEESVPPHLLPGACVTRSVPPSAVPCAAPPPETGSGSPAKDVSER
ncbi:hypothetical protein [Streptomyces sp. YU58]|uniref:hypothetical protein n=1 Tax=Streptomyces sp. SX92 TaxID=3158972 RepID=UPI0027BAE6FC|nr:hypothetical protein [Streptomyces coralus]WLW51666.1 hypothetical protein QU709_09915 [Streptomyces coralus]